MPWLNWHTLCRTHATLFQQAGGTLREAQAQRNAVENLSDLVNNGDELAKLGGNLPLATERIQ